MKLKPIPLLLLLPALMVLVACGGASEPTPDIEATVEARVKERLAAIPTPTARIVVKEVVKEVIVEKIVVVTATPTATATPTPTPTQVPPTATHTPTPTPTPISVLEALSSEIRKGSTTFIGSSSGALGSNSITDSTYLGVTG